MGPRSVLPVYFCWRIAAWRGPTQCTAREQVEQDVQKLGRAMEQRRRGCGVVVAGRGQGLTLGAASARHNLQKRTSRLPRRDTITLPTFSPLTSQTFSKTSQLMRRARCWPLEAWDYRRHPAQRRRCACCGAGAAKKAMRDRESRVQRHFQLCRLRRRALRPRIFPLRQGRTKSVQSKVRRMADGSSASRKADCPYLRLTL